MSIHNQVEDNSLVQISYVLLNCDWFYEHKYTPIISYLKNKIFIEECKKFIDEYDNNLCHYICLNISSFTKLTYLILKWLIKIGVSINKNNKKGNSAFFYLMHYWYANDFKENGVEYFENILEYVKKDNQNHNGDTFIHMLCHSKQNDLLSNIELMRKIIDKNVDLLKIRNKKKQLPLHIALSYWKGQSMCKLLYYLMLKTPSTSYTLCDMNGRNIYHLLLEYNNIHLIKYFIKRYPNMISLPLQNELKTPSIFIILINHHDELLDMYLKTYPKLFLEKDKKNTDVLDILYQYYILTSKTEYVDIINKLWKCQLFEKDKILDVLKKIKMYSKYGNYICHICNESKSDIREWEIPYICKNHDKQLFHMSCLKKWLKYDKTCPMCAYK